MDYGDYGTFWKKSLAAVALRSNLVLMLMFYLEQTNRNRKRRTFFKCKPRLSQSVESIIDLQQRKKLSLHSFKYFNILLQYSVPKYFQTSSTVSSLFVFVLECQTIYILSFSFLVGAFVASFIKYINIEFKDNGSMETKQI